MNKTGFLAVTILLFSLLTTAQSIENSFKNAGDDWATVNGDGFSMDYPGDWDLDESGLMGTTFVVLSQVTSGTDLFRENINLLIQDLAGQDIDLDKYVEISEGQVASMITDGELVSSERKKKGKQEYHKIVYTGKQGQFDLKFIQYYLLKDEQAYVLTFTCEIDQFDNYVELGEAALNSFKLK